MSNPIVLHASLENIQSHQDDPIAYRNYIRLHEIDQALVCGFAGACVVRNVMDCGNQRFDFANGEAEQLPAFVCEAFGSDGESLVDLVAWPLDSPNKVMSMFGRCGLLGAWEAMNPATYFMDSSLVMHRTPLEWLQAGCRGAVVVTPYVAARMFLDLPGKIAARDDIHGRQLEALRRSVLPKDQILVPTGHGEIAA